MVVQGTIREQNRKHGILPPTFTILEICTDPQSHVAFGVPPHLFPWGMYNVLPIFFAGVRVEHLTFHTVLQTCTKSLAYVAADCVRPAGAGSPWLPWTSLSGLGPKPRPWLWSKGTPHIIERASLGSASLDWFNTTRDNWWSYKSGLSLKSRSKDECQHYLEYSGTSCLFEDFEGF